MNNCLLYLILKRGVKISELTQAIIFFSLTNVLKIFNVINAGAGLCLATPAHNC